MFCLIKKLLYALLDGKDDKSVDKDNLQNSKSCNHFRFGKLKTTKNISTNERRLFKLVWYVYWWICTQQIVKLKQTKNTKSEID